MSLELINEKTGLINEKELEEYVKRVLKNKLKKCNFTECFVEPIMVEAIVFSNKGEKSNQQLELKLSRIFHKYQAKCNYSTEDLKKSGRNHIAKLDDDEFEKQNYADIEDVVLDYLPIFLNSKINKYDINNTTTLLTFFENGLKFHYYNWKKKNLDKKGYDELDSIIVGVDADNNITLADITLSKDPTPEEAYEEVILEEMREEAMEIAREILGNPKIVTRTIGEVLEAYMRSKKANGNVNYKELDEQLGKQSGSVSKNLTDFSKRVNDYLEKNYYDFIHDPDNPDGKRLIKECLEDELNKMV